MNESARRWSGYVCPDCRLVFRVPRDHDGQGVVCQNCRRLLRLPAAGDPTPPLVAEPVAPPLNATTTTAATTTTTATTAAPAMTPAAAVLQRIKHRVRKRRTGAATAGGAAPPSWDHQTAATAKSRRHDRRPLRWLLAGAVALLGVVAGGLGVAWHGKEQVTPPQARHLPQLTPPPPATAPGAAEPVVSALMQRSVPSILAEAEPLARKFLEATTIAELLPLVRQPERAKPRMQRQYPQGHIDPPGLAQFNPTGNVGINEAGAMVDVRTRNFASRQLVLVATPAGLKIDWESWVGWSDLSWSTLLATLPTQATLFRVIVKRVDYYNFGFSDDKQWQSFRLESQDGEHMIFGYVQRGSAVEAKLRISPDATSTPMILKIRFPAGVAASNNQVVVDEVLANGWVEPDT